MADRRNATLPQARHTKKESKVGEAGAHSLPRACQRHHWNSAGEVRPRRPGRQLLESRMPTGSPHSSSSPAFPRCALIIPCQDRPSEEPACPLASQLLLLPACMITEPKPQKGPWAERSSASWTTFPDAPPWGAPRHPSPSNASLCPLPLTLPECEAAGLIRRQKTR